MLPGFSSKACFIVSLYDMGINPVYIVMGHTRIHIVWLLKSATRPVSVNSVTCFRVNGHLPHCFQEHFIWPEYL